MAKLLDGKEIATAEQLVNIEDKVEALEEKLENSVIFISEEIKKKISVESVFEIDPEEIRGEKGDSIKGDKGDSYVLTDEDKMEIALSIDVPIVEKIIEITEVVKEQPVITNNVTNEIKEVAVTDEPLVIAEKLNTLKEVIEPDVIKGYRELERISKLNAFNPTMGPSFADLKNINTRIDNLPTGGGSSINLETNGTPNGSQTLLNLKQGTNMTITDDGVGGITFDASGAGSGDMLKSTYDPQNLGYISGATFGAGTGGVLQMIATGFNAGSIITSANTSGAGGHLKTYAGNGNNSYGGALLTYGGTGNDSPGGYISTFGSTMANAPGGYIDTTGSATTANMAGGYIKTSGYADVGGNIDTSSGSSTGGRGGNIYSYGMAAHGGDILTYGGNGSTLYLGGTIDTHGDTAAGGNIITANGGGIIDTVSGYMQLGLTGARTTITSAASSDWNFILPVDAGTSGYILQSTGGGGTVWASVSSLGDMTKAVYDPQNSGYISGVNNGSGTGGTIQIGAGVNSNGGSIFMIGSTGGAGGNLYTAGSSGGSGGDIFTYASTYPGGHIYTRDGGGSIDTTGTGSIQLGSPYLTTCTTLAGAASSNYTFTFPTDGGTNNYVLSTNGSGTTSWVPAGAGGGDVFGPGTAGDSDIALFDGTTGKLIKDSGYTLAGYVTVAQAEANSSITPCADNTYTFDITAPNTVIAITTVSGIITNITIV